MRRFRSIPCLLLLSAFLAGMAAVCAVAQDDPNELPLGDVARNLRKNSQPVQQVIDDDNLKKVMQEAESEHSVGRALKFLMTGESKNFQVAAPDVTCSLSFTANSKALLSSQYSEMDLPADEAAKIQGPATIEGDALTVSVFNGTNWHVSEIAVALTIVKKQEASSQFQEVRLEKKSDLTVVYHMRAAAPPWESAVFSAPLTIDLAPDQEWHWAIVQAKGYPPQNFVASDGPSPN